MIAVHSGDSPRLPHVIAVADAASSLTMALGTMTSADPATRAVADALASLASIGWTSQKVKDDAYTASAWLERAGAAPSSPARSSAASTTASLPASGLTAEQQARVDASVDRIEREHQERLAVARKAPATDFGWSAAFKRVEAGSEGRAPLNNADDVWSRAHAAAGLKPRGER